jgi:Recombinase
MRFIGFYWTLPVPWAGFTSLPPSVDAAAEVSRSIRYQRDRVRRWVKDEGGTLVHEACFLDVQADRGTTAVLPEVEKLLTKASALDATLVLVNFAEAFHWRPHGPLWDRLGREARVMALDPAPELIDGTPFDPVRHFRGWVDAAAAHTAAKAEARARVAERVAGLRAAGESYAAIARMLADEGVTTPDGKIWRADNLRKLVAAG